MKFVKPEAWPDAVFLGIGAVLGFAMGFGGAELLDARLSVAFAIAGGAALLGGILALMLREDLVEILVLSW
jgi:hypothetical protein